MSVISFPPRPARFAGVQIIDLDPQPRVENPHSTNCGVLVDSTSLYANPFETDAHSAQHDRAGAAVRYAVWLAGNAAALGALAPLVGRDLGCSCALSDPGCHRGVLLDILNPPHCGGGGNAMGLTVRRPWASMLLVPEQVGGKTVDNRTWATDYRGPVLIYAGSRVDAAGVEACEAAQFDTAWHVKQQGWLGAAVLVDVHRARGQCCRPWGHRSRRDRPIYHWVFDHPHRLARRPWLGRGFEGLRQTSWSVLLHADAHRIVRPAHGRRLSFTERKQCDEHPRSEMCGDPTAGWSYSSGNQQVHRAITSARSGQHTGASPNRSGV